MHPLQCVIGTRTTGASGNQLNYFSNLCLHLCPYENFVEAATIFFPDFVSFTLLQDLLFFFFFFFKRSGQRSFFY